MSIAIAGTVPAYVTREILEGRDACAGQVELFVQVFPGGGEVTAANIRRAAAAGLDLDWFAGAFLTPPVLRAYDEAKVVAWRSYREARAAAMRAYTEAMTPAWWAYMEAKTATWPVSTETRKTAQQAYDEAKAKAWPTYMEAEAAAKRAYTEATVATLIDALGLARDPGRNDP